MLIDPLQPVAVVALVGVFLFIRWKRAQAAKADAGKGGKSKDPAAAYMDLRRQALATVPGRLGLVGELKPDEPFGILMEMSIADSVVTLACFADGDARLLYQKGGGMMGGIAHETVRKAAKDLTALAKRSLPKMSRAAGQPLPGPEKVRFYVLTRRGPFTVEVDRQVLGETRSELAGLFASGQEVVNQMRQVQEQKRADLRPPPLPPSD